MNRLIQIIATLLAITFMVIILVPCADGCATDSHQIESSIQTAQEHHEEHNDICSPLCSCSCCSTQITVTSLINFEVVKHTVARTFVIIDTPFHHTLYFSIWQPPKIS